jgi:hypothetical protein
MATKENTSSSNQTVKGWNPLTYSSGAPLSIAIRPDALEIEVIDLLSARLASLDSLLMATCGEAGESFRCRSDDMHDSYMFSCAETASECRALFSALTAKKYQGGAA